MFQFKTARVLAWLCAALFISSTAQATDVHFAGLAFSGDGQSIPTRFPYTKRYLNGLERDKVRVASVVYKAMAANKPANFDLAPLAAQANLRGEQQTIVVALVLNNETVSLERFGSVAKFFVQLRGQALFFDFKSMSVLRAYPLSFAYIDLLDHYPDESEIDERIRVVFNGTDKKPGLYSRFAAAVHKATLPGQTPCFLQVGNVSVSPEAVKGLPDTLTSVKGASETWLADMLAEAISNRTGVPMLPYAKGYAVGKVMSMKVADGEVYNLKMPEADYAFSLALTGVKKVELQKTAAEAAFVYGAYATVRFDEPFSNKNYLDLALKNGETKLVPSTQDWVDDIPPYADAMRGLFNKLGENLAGNTTPWLKTAATGNNVDRQIQQTTEKLKSCK